MRWTTLFAALLLLVGCATKPSAELGLIRGPEDLTGEEVDTYAFPKSYVDVEVAEGRLQVEVRSASYEGFRVALRRRDAIGVKTNINVDKRDNSDLVDKAGVEVFDSRAKLIADVGKLATSVVGLGLFSADNPSLPNNTVTSVDTAVLQKSLPRTGSLQDPRKPRSWVIQEGGYRFWFGPVEPDAAAIATASLEGLRSGMIYSACRELRVSQDVSGNETPLTATAFVSEPNYYRYVAFPRKGQVEFHAQCGTSVKSEKDESISTDAAVMSVLLDEIQKVRTAVKDRQEEDEEPAQAGTPQ